MKEQRHNYLIKDKLPSDWDILPIEKIVAKDKGSIKIGPFGSSLKKEYLVKEGYKVYGQENIIEEDFTLGERFIDRERFELLRTNEILPGDIVMSMMGTIGKVLIVPDSIQKGIMDSHLLRIRLDENLMNKDFFIQLFKDYYPTYKQIQRMSVGGIMSGLSSSIIRKIKLPVPPLKEQLKISSILSVWDKAIELKEKLIEQKKELKKGLMQKLLTGEVRLPGFNGTWVEVRLESLSKKMKSGGTPKVNNRSFYSGDIPFVKVNDITTSGKYLFNTEESITTEGLENSSAWIVPRNSILYSMYASVGFVSINKVEVATNQAIMAIIPNKKIDLEYLYYSLVNYQDKIYRFIEKGTQGNINAKLVKNIRLSIPTIQEQKSIAKILATLDNEIFLLEKELKELKQQKKGLMQLLLTGKVRVKV